VQVVAVATREGLCEGGKRNDEVGALRISGGSGFESIGQT
jgi:hypothetical protein